LATSTSLQLEYRSVGRRFWLLWARKCWDSLRQKRRRTGLFLRDALFAVSAGAHSRVVIGVAWEMCTVPVLGWCHGMAWWVQDLCDKDAVLGRYVQWTFWISFGIFLWLKRLGSPIGKIGQPKHVGIKNRRAQIFEKCSKFLKILETRGSTCSRSHTEEP